MPRACVGQRDTMQTHAERDSEDNTCRRRLTPYQLWWNMLSNVRLKPSGSCATPSKLLLNSFRKAMSAGYSAT